MPVNRNSLLVIPKIEAVFYAFTIKKYFLEIPAVFTLSQRILPSCQEGAVNGKRYFTFLVVPSSAVTK